MNKKRWGLVVGASICLVTSMLVACSDSTSGDDGSKPSGGQGGVASSIGGAGGDGISKGGVSTGGLAGEGGDATRCECGDDPQYFHVPSDCAPLGRTYDQELSYIQDPKDNALAWPYLLQEATCPSGYRAIEVHGGCEYFDSVIFDPQGRRLVDRSDPDFAKVCASRGSGGGLPYDAAEKCERCTVSWHGWGNHGEAGAAGEGGAFSDLRACYSGISVSPTCQGNGGAGGAN